MLARVRLNKDFWAKALNIISYLINRSPSVTLEFKIPMEMWTSQVINFNYLRSYGCTTYAHITLTKLGQGNSSMFS